MRQFEFTDRAFFKPPIREFHGCFYLDAILKFGFQIFRAILAGDAGGHRETVLLWPVFDIKLLVDSHVIDFSLSQVVDDRPIVGRIKFCNYIFLGYS